MKILKNILLGILGLVALLFIISVFLPSTYKVERSLAMNKSADSVFNQINNLHHWQSWDPWNKKDPTVKTTYLGPEEGVGATQQWTSEESGNGKLTILESKQPNLVIYQVEFEGFDPMQGRFEIDANSDSTCTVSWIAEGDMGNNPIKKYFGAMMDRMMGADFEEGLANLNN